MLLVEFEMNRTARPRPHGISQYPIVQSSSFTFLFLPPISHIAQTNIVALLLVNNGHTRTESMRKPPIEV